MDEDVRQILQRDRLSTIAEEASCRPRNDRVRESGAQRRQGLPYVEKRHSVNEISTMNQVTVTRASWAIDPLWQEAVARWRTVCATSRN